MGNECCASRSKESAFSDLEISQLRSLYNDLVGPRRAKGKTRFNKNTLKVLYEESPDVARAVYELMVHTGAENKDLANTTPVEVLLKDPNNVRLKQYKLHEKIDIFALMMIGDYTHGKEDLRAIYISYVRALDFVKILLRIFQYDSGVPKLIDEYAARVIVDAVFKEDEGRTDWWTFIHYIKENLIYINRGLKLYFNAKFLNQKINLKLPTLDKASYILNRDIVGLLYFSNVYMHTIKNLQFIYSSRYNGLSFDKITQALERYNAPTYLFFKVAPIENEADKKDARKDRTYTIGGFSRLPWKDTNGYSGDSDCHIFSLAPKFKNFYALTNQTVNTNYTYLSSKGYKKGIGFGGKDFRNFRIWIDGTDFAKSYVGNEDNTYSSGPLTEPGLTSINIIEVEIWGFGTDFHGIEGLNSLQRSSVDESKTWISYNQSKVTELVDQSAGLARALSQLDNQVIQATNEGAVVTRTADGTQTTIQRGTNETQPESAKKSSLPLTYPSVTRDSNVRDSATKTSQVFQNPLKSNS